MHQGIEIYVLFIIRLIGAMIGIYGFRKFQSSYLLIAAQMGVSILIDLIAIYWADIYHSNYEVYNIYIPMETLLLGWAAWFSLPTEKGKNRLRIILNSYAIVAIVSTLLIDLHVFNVRLLILSFLMLTGLSLYQLIDPQTKEKSPLKNPMIIIITANLLYFCCDLPMFIGREYLLSSLSSDVFDTLFFLTNQVLANLRYSSYTIALIILLIHYRKSLK
jgi:hypothetical protein